MNKKHKKFADIYLKDPTRNARRAYMQVYPKVKENVADAAASRLLKNVKVSEYVKSVEKKSTEDVELSVAWVKEKLKRFSTANLVDLYADDGAITIEKLKLLPRELTDCIQEIQHTKDGIKVKLVDKKGSVDSIAKIFGAFTDNINVYGLTFADALKRRKQERETAHP